jgi:hypothetical protein
VDPKRRGKNLGNRIPDHQVSLIEGSENPIQFGGDGVNLPVGEPSVERLGHLPDPEMKEEFGIEIPDLQGDHPVRTSVVFSLQSKVKVPEGKVEDRSLRGEQDLQLAFNLGPPAIVTCIEINIQQREGGGDRSILGSKEDLLDVPRDQNFFTVVELVEESPPNGHKRPCTLGGEGVVEKAEGRHKTLQRIFQAMVVLDFLAEEDVVMFGCFAEGPDVVLPTDIQSRSIPRSQGATLKVVRIDRRAREIREITRH